MHRRIRLDQSDAIATLRRIPLSSLRDYLLPEVGPEFLRHLRLTVRTQNCLRHLFQEGRVGGLGDLHNHTVGELLDTANFGVKSLFDLLQAIQPFAKPPSKDSSPDVVVTDKDVLSVSEVDSILARKLFSLTEIGHLCLPEIAGSAELANLPLKFRTRGCLEKLYRDGLITEAKDLSNIEVFRLLKTANFGKLTLIDLLKGLRPYMRDGDQPRAAAPVELSRALEKLRNSPLCGQIRCDDPRFKRELVTLLAIASSSHSSATLPTDTVTDLTARLCLAEFSVAEAGRALLSIQSLRRGIRRALQLRLERELSEVVRSELDERTAEVVSRVYGLDGSGGATLQEAGDEYGVTRERIRQICDRVSGLVKLQPFVPKLEMCLKATTSRLPNRADSIENLLLERRLTQSKFRLEGLRLAAELLNKPIRFDVTELNGVRVAVRISKPAVANKILSLANRSVSKSGVCAVSDIVENLHEERESVISVLSTKSTVQWLGQDQEWFLISDSKHNRLLNFITKIAAVAPSIHVGELRRAVSRSYRLAIVPPRAVFPEFCRQFGWRVDGEVVTVRAGLGLEGVLSQTERTMVAVLRERGPVLYRTEFQELCAARGIIRNTFSMYVGANPLFSRVATGVYALTGAPVSPSDVESCLRRNRAPVVTISDCGWTLEAKPWIALQISPTVAGSGVFSVPTSMRGFLLGRYVIETADGTEVGKIQVAEQNSWGLGTLIRRRGVEPGDFIVLEFNLQQRRVKAYLGGPEIVESFCDAGSE